MYSSAMTPRPSRWLCVTLCVCSAGTVAADEIDEYAVPDDIDEYGTVFEVTEVPSHMLEVLDEENEYVIPTFINQTVRRGEQECWVVEQIPAAGTKVSCPQTVMVQLRYTCSGSDEFTTRLPIDVIDVHPPDLHVELASAADPHVSFGGVLRYPADAAVLPMISVYDACGVQNTEYLLNGEPYLPGMPITGVGLHVLSVIASDESDNEAGDSYFFEIRERPSHTAAVVVKDSQCVYDSNGDVESMEITVLIAGADFDHEDILLSSVRMMVGDSAGRWVNPEAINIKGAFLPGGRELQYESVVAKLEPCNYVAVFAADFSEAPLEECPSFIDVFGVGQANGEITFEWGSRALNIADSNAYQTIAGLIDVQPCVPCNPQDPDCDPPVEPPVPCEEVELLLVDTNTCTVPWVAAPAATCGAGSGTMSNAIASTAVGGNSRSSVGPPASMVCTQGSSCGIIVGGAMLIVDFVGNCCNCAVTYTAAASVGAFVFAGGAPPFVGLWTASASASGSITLDPPSGPLTATATATITATESNPKPVVPPSRASATVTDTVTGCGPSFMGLGSSAFVGTTAFATSAVFVLSNANARATLTGNLADFSATIVFLDCDDCEGGPDDCGPWIEPKTPE